MNVKERAVWSMKAHTLPLHSMPASVPTVHAVADESRTIGDVIVDTIVTILRVADVLLGSVLMTVCNLANRQKI